MDDGVDWKKTSHSNMDKKIQAIVDDDSNVWYKGLCVDIYISEWVVKMGSLVEGQEPRPRTVADKYLVLLKDRAMSLTFWETLSTTFATSDEILYLYTDNSFEAYAWMNKDMLFRRHIADVVEEDDEI